MRQAGAAPCSVEDLIETGGGQRLAAAWAFQDAEDVSVPELVGLGWAFETEPGSTAVGNVTAPAGRR